MVGKKEGGGGREEGEVLTRAGLSSISKVSCRVWREQTRRADPPAQCRNSALSSTNRPTEPCHFYHHWPLAAGRQTPTGQVSSSLGRCGPVEDFWGKDLRSACFSPPNPFSLSLLHDEPRHVTGVGSGYTRGIRSSIWQWQCSTLGSSTHAERERVAAPWCLARAT